jgi:antitoxin component YwqK of YwqJK toxin-antitoxin module
MKLYITLICLLINLSGGRLDYVKSFYDNGNLKAEGWMDEDSKENYWYHYYPNGNLKSKGSFKYNKKSGYWFYYDELGSPHKEGHYKKGLATSWWRYYDGDTTEIVKLERGKREGLSLFKVDGKPVKAEYFKNDKRTHEWYSLAEFRKDKSDLEKL